MKSRHDFARPHLEAFASQLLRHTRDESINASNQVTRLPASRYQDEDYFRRERDQLFSRVPLMLAASCELTENRYRAMEVAGIPVLLLRDRSGSVRAFLNSCPHRGAIIASDEGTATRFTCPYHGWTFRQDGRMAGQPLSEVFGDAGQVGLIDFQAFESAGMIWVILNRESPVSPAAFFSGFDQLLEVFDLASWHFLNRRTLPGPNWKLCFDAHLDFYHLPVLHRQSFGPRMSPRAIYGYWGPHQRLAQPRDSKAGVRGDINLFQGDPDRPGDWPLASMMLGEWIIFPNVSINIFYRGGLGMLISQVIPGRHSDESVTVQSYYLAEPPDDSALSEAAAQHEFLARVVGNEDLPVSAGQQLAIGSGFVDEFIFGRNEGGLQAFHAWVDRVLDTDDAGLDALFQVTPGWQFAPSIADQAG